MKRKCMMIMFCHLVKVGYSSLTNKRRITAVAFTTSSSYHSIKVNEAISSQRKTRVAGCCGIYRDYHASRGQMVMWGEGNGNSGDRANNNRKPKLDNYDNQRSIPITTPDSRNRIVTDSEGRNLRRRGNTNKGREVNQSTDAGSGGWDDFDDSYDNSSSFKYRNNNKRSRNRNTNNYKNKGWDDFENDDRFSSEDNFDYEYDANRPNNRRNFSNNNIDNRGNYDRERVRNNNNNGNRSRGARTQNSRFQDKNNRRGNFGGTSQKQQQWKRGEGNKQKTKDNNADPSNKINLRALEGAGFDHLYGLAPILNALASKRRDFTTSQELNDDNIDDEISTWDRFSKLGQDNLQENSDQELRFEDRDIKPEATFKPYLFIQESKGYNGGKVGNKALAAGEVQKLAAELDISIAEVDKGVLNTLCQNRPHQGYVLRCGGLNFTPLSRIPYPENDDDSAPNLWLVLDEIMDPQNFGALLRSAYFLGGGSGCANDRAKKNKIGIMVCSKNSAPPSPVVSAASAGALELCEVYSTSNLPRTLNTAKADGWRILGAAASVPSGMVTDDGEPAVCQDLLEVHAASKDLPTVLVLGSEGHGLRTLVAKACTGFVMIPGALDSTNQEDFEERSEDNSSVGVDSLNVSVTGGIMLWNLLNGNK